MLATHAPDDPMFHTDSSPTCGPTQVSTNAMVNALTPTAMSDKSTLNAVLSLTKTFDQQVRLNEQHFQEQEDKINLLSKLSQWFPRGCGRCPRSRGSFHGTPHTVP